MTHLPRRTRSLECCLRRMTKVMMDFAVVANRVCSIAPLRGVRPSRSSSKPQLPAGFSSLRNLKRAMVTARISGPAGHIEKQTHCAGQIGGRNSAHRDSFRVKIKLDPIGGSKTASAVLPPYWTQIDFLGSLQPLEKYGGDDGTRTRGLCRDRAAF
jgi:hypothetical protein